MRCIACNRPLTKYETHPSRLIKTTPSVKVPPSVYEDLCDKCAISSAAAYTEGHLKGEDYDRPTY